VGQLNQKKTSSPHHMLDSNPRHLVNRKENKEREKELKNSEKQALTEVSRTGTDA
jgi:hypothetical protein